MRVKQDNPSVDDLADLARLGVVGALGAVFMAGVMGVDPLRIVDAVRSGARGRRRAPKKSHVQWVNPYALPTVGDRIDLKILGLPLGVLPTAEALKDARNRAIRAHHPDRGGDATRAAAINAAYGRLAERVGRPD